MHVATQCIICRLIIIVHICIFLVFCTDHQSEAVFHADEEKATLIVDNPCRKYGCLCESSTIACFNVEPDGLDQHILKLVPDAHNISFTKCSQKHLNLHIFENFTSLRSIAVHDCNIQQLFPSALDSLQSLRVLNLSRNYLWNWNEICIVLNQLSSLQIVDLSRNWFSKLSHTDQCVVNKLQHLSLSFNQVSELSMVPNVISLDVSSNGLIRIYGEWPFSLEDLNLSNNPSVERFPSLSLIPQLSNLNMDNCGLTVLPLSISLNLRHLSLQYNKLTFIDFDSVNLPSLQKLDLRNSFRLHSIVGMLPTRVRDFRLTNTQMRYLPPDFFIRAKSLRFVEIMPNNWSCDNCLNKWAKMLPFKLRPQMGCADDLPNNCSLGISKRVKQGAKYILRVPYAEAAILPCDAYGELPLFIKWWLVKPKVLIGSYNFENRIIIMNWSRNGTYEIIPGGLLLINIARKELVERYRCVVSNLKGNASQLVHFRLDYSSWFRLEMVKSVFWGSILAAVITCSITFIFNLLWITCRHIGLWWIKRIERNSHVREMVAAVERYRQRQMCMLSETYHKKLEQIRDNYRQQVGQLCSSYTSQSERFRDYRAAQMESMNHHLENIRDNYSQQMCKLRDYGSKRVEQLWEGYERQVNRLRMFSLHQRLSLMHKYKVKQQYLNKLVAKFADNPQLFMKPEPEVILMDSVRELDIQTHRRIRSFHSLPEYVLREDDMSGTLRSEMIREFHDQKLFMLDAYDVNHEAPCCSKQLQSKRGSNTLELIELRQRYSPSNVDIASDNWTLNLNDESEPLHNDGSTSPK
ncbi:leucine Rich Repeat family protein [Loa loa]|uniref:Leucine Rich Repeat family protein n=1 Tax=Loa loa TaxID=7209 RepID=A0A1I7VTA9_LOALO|nr:leucine Rich Repeat family protein [Loa loa]EFO27559.1 leucine Rich Repeat family protein [Loa loa]